MESQENKIDWTANAGKQLDALAQALPPLPKLDITVFGSAPLQLLIDPAFLSEDIDVYSPEEQWELEIEHHGHTFRFVHPWDVLVSKLQRLDPKDLQAFQLVIAKTGHPTEAEFIKHLQKAVDLYRPKFDEETTRGDMLANTRELWKILWHKEIDVRTAIIRPALERSRHDYDVNPTVKTRLANLKLPEKK